ncbi:MAG: methylcobamide--CoM methyltransferase [Clostridia bacterium]|uniref:uroporphyrinogen decarboxylase family protein n=1 Tax=Petroclostridium xylanilyticum TaxID=1792311 RepID=UPI001FA84B06|nr:uroporphyrinogen decarboxylase family protein [Petroclostridium xylanilyticum]MBZ4644781.1 methylcobamide--CoM methyltransferase [Clostridia bacterium]
MRKWLFEILSSKERCALPIMTYPGLEFVKKNIMDVITDGKAQYECMEALAKKYPSAAAVTIMDLSVEAEAFGSPVKFSYNEVPAVSARIITDMESANALKIPKVGDARTSVYIKAAELAAKNIKDRPVFGGEIGPFSLAGRLLDMTEIMVLSMLEPEMVHTVLEKCTEFLIEFAKAFKSAEANGIIIAEPAAGLLSPEMCTEFSSNYVKKIVEAVQDDHFMVILHNCGNTKNLVPSLLSTGAMGYHFGNAVKMEDIMPQMPWGRVAFGNIDPAGVFKNGTVSDMESKVWELLEKTAIYKNFVLSSGCDVPPGTSLENVEVFYDTLERFNNTVFKKKSIGTVLIVKIC